MRTLGGAPNAGQKRVASDLALAAVAVSGGSVGVVVLEAFDTRAWTVLVLSISVVVNFLAVVVPIGRTLQVAAERAPNASVRVLQEHVEGRVRGFSILLTTSFCGYAAIVGLAIVLSHLATDHGFRSALLAAAAVVAGGPIGHALALGSLARRIRVAEGRDDLLTWDSAAFWRGERVWDRLSRTPK